MDKSRGCGVWVHAAREKKMKFGSSETLFPAFWAPNCVYKQGRFLISTNVFLYNHPDKFKFYLRELFLNYFN